MGFKTLAKTSRQTVGARALPNPQREARTALFGTRVRRIVLASGFLLGLAPNLYPVTRTWDGGGGDSNITTGLNWVGDVAPVSGDSLYFAGSLRLTPLLNSNLSVSRLTFNSGSGAFVLGGTGIYTVNKSGITNSSTNTQTIGNAIALSRSQSWNATSGDLVITGAVNTSGRKITFNGGKNSTLTNVVSGTGSITQSGVGSLTLSGNNTYTGITTLSAGTLIIGSNTAMGTGALTITAGTLATNGTARTLTNTSTVNGSFTFNSPSDLTLSGTAALGNNITVTVRELVR
jgi:autotransporter-associated beta strand protein